MDVQLIQEKIYTVRGRRVMLDHDLAVLYDVETKRLKEAVRRNIGRFPDDFMYALTRDEYQSLRTQFASLDKGRRGEHIKYYPFAFTEQGIAMLSSVLHSEKAIQMNIVIMRAFIAIRQIALQYQELALEVMDIRHTVTGHSEQLVLINLAIEKLLGDKADQVAWEERERIGFGR
ncbi:ORF6N domain-containing protein [Sediminibacterium soli]|uniref:ORF6N domain-containing protein n=1 Tax=Sediminibacterium soli TaxID=2698829 RepID=UPI00137B08A5|nr:ORF6N domain-containing protein [Sediminibacterium soli]NCI47217.1 ORF6N domain-containing protein [Sediminibacterium soli]